MQIQCPSCSAKFSLGELKPGKFQPKCKKCLHRFALEISDEDPPTIRVSKLKRKPSSATKTAVTEATQADSATQTVSDETIDPHTDGAAKATPQSGRRAADPEATLDAASASQTTPETARQVDQTHDGASQSASDQSVSHRTHRGTVSAGTGTASSSSDEASGRNQTVASAGHATAAGSVARPDSAARPKSDSRPASSEPSTGDDPSRIPKQLGGYRIIKMLGRGAMGAVYQAKQISLDREVALKTIRGRLADNPSSLARFTREAYAAAQLTHHNVVQIYDFGEDNGQHYFSMEWVRGGTLSDLVKEKGCIDPKIAAGYIAQAARGLQYAHRSGMVHRDVKPANLLLSEDGVIKVADLGLVKIPDEVDPEVSPEAMTASGRQSGTQVTLQGSAIGTPAYMAPEQSTDATTVDHRADIYSLGCSLFYLLAGRSPYDGTVASEVIEQHAKAPVPDISEINHRVPEPLVQTVTRAMAKRADQRYASLAEMISDLEAFLGIESESGFSPSGEQADRWEAIAAAYAKTQTLRRFSGTIFVGFVFVSLLATLIAPLASLWAVLFGPTLFVAACATAILLGTLGGNNAIGLRLRQWFGNLSWFEKALGGFAAIVFLMVVLISGLWVGVVPGVILGIAAGAGYHFGIAATAQKAGQGALDEAKRYVRDMRISGADETGLRDFLARYAGNGWQTVFEALFGYDAMIQVRDKLTADPAFDGPTSNRSLRDRFCAGLAARIERKRHEKQQDKLAKVEQRSLISQGLSASEAREKGWEMAGAIMESAKMPIEAKAQDESAIANAKRQRIKAMLADARSGKYKKKRDAMAPVKFALGGHSRLLAGCLLLGLFAVVGQASGLFQAEVLDQVSSGNFESGEATTDTLGQSTSVGSIGIAGLLLCVSGLMWGWRLTPFALVATMVILFGPHFGIPDLGPIKAWMIAAAAGLIVYVPGFMMAEEQ